MAFDFKYLTSVQQTNNLDKTLNVKAGMDTQARPQMWCYDASSNGADDTKAETVASDYFLSAYAYLKAGDLVYVYASDGYQMLYVTASSSVTVTTAAGWAS